MAETTPDRDRIWPSLPLEGWRSTKETLHRYRQIIGKVRLALAPFANHWWHVTLRIDPTGLTTGAMPIGDGRLAEVRLDLVRHRCEVRVSTGQEAHFPDRATGLRRRLRAAVRHARRPRRLRRHRPSAV